MITSTEVVLKTREFLGVPYRHQGRSRDCVDCIGLLVMVARELSIFDPTRFIPANYTARPKDGLLEKYVGEICVPSRVPVAGGIALFRWASRAPAAHCAILTYEETMIHSYRQVEKVVEHGFRGKWPTRVHSYWRLPNVAYPVTLNE